MQKEILLIAICLISSLVFAEENEGVNKSVSAKEEFRVKREEVFEFVQKPQITNQDNNFVISFESKGFCDVTVAIENAEGKILRHLVSGVLGPKAPAPLQKNSKVQKIIWDGKDDQELYVKNEIRNECSVRVSLGLKPQFERTMFWSPKKRLGSGNPVMHAAPEGVYIAESGGIDQVRLFDHQGNYLKTIYPFPGDKLDKVEGLKMHTFIQDGKAKPLKRGFLQGTLLKTDFGEGAEGLPLNAITSLNGKIAVSSSHLNRLALDGSSGGLPFNGPQIAVTNDKKERFSARSMAFSPDGKWLYITGYSKIPHISRSGWLNAVTRMPYDGSQAPTLWIGDLSNEKSGSKENELRMPTSLACDSIGRVYVSDYMNDRIQVFSPEGIFLKTIPVVKPSKVAIHHKTGDIYVFSFLMVERGWNYDVFNSIDPTMTHLGNFENPTIKNKCVLPLTEYSKNHGFNVSQWGFQHMVELDSWAEKPTIWIANGRGVTINYNDDGSIRDIQVNAGGGCAQLYEETENSLTLKHSFVDEIRKTITRITPPTLWRQRLVVNPANSKLYILEGDSGMRKSVNQLIEITPETGVLKLVELPLGAEDLCFDLNGLAYIRTDVMVVRYDPTTWKEIPFDYGIEKDNHSYGMGAKSASMVSGLLTPGHRTFNFWHLGGMDVSVKGHIAVTTCNGFEMANTPQWHPGEARFKYDGRPYKPALYPGRMRWGEIHIFDKYGKVVREDAVPGMGHLNGIGIDQDDNIYMLASAIRIFDGKQTDPAMGDDASGTVIKVIAGKNKVYSSDNTIPVPLPIEQQPKRSIDIAGFTTGWVEGAEWLYGGVGLSRPGGCVCWNARFCKDYYNRSFAPENQNYSVAVIDSSGNLILRVGKYGNVDDGKPMIAEGGPKETKSIGGDEVGLFYANFVGTHTDKKLFIADAGNTRILSVKLGYHAEEKILLKNMINKK